MIAITKNQNELIRLNIKKTKLSTKINIKKYAKNLVGFILGKQQAFRILPLLPCFVDHAS